MKLLLNDTVCEQARRASLETSRAGGLEAGLDLLREREGGSLAASRPREGTLGLDAGTRTSELPRSPQISRPRCGDTDLVSPRISPTLDA